MDGTNEVAWSGGICRLLLAMIESAHQEHTFLRAVSGGNAAIERALRVIEEDYAWLIKVASELDGEVSV
ncbi:hypothetical protein VM98_24900 [Streptomyces rubellomurinus subsp. indigoferus]|nr:hypothetical protein VM98_24900 [Streptomyces rubellomurinus subsp. indigoferus]